MHIAIDDGATVAVRVGQPLSEMFAKIGYPRTRDGRVLDTPEDWRDPDVDLVWRRGNLDIGWGYSLTSDDVWLYLVVIYGDDAKLGNGLAVGATIDEVIETMGEPDIWRPGRSAHYWCNDPGADIYFSLGDGFVEVIRVECEDCH